MKSFKRGDCTEVRAPKGKVPKATFNVLPSYHFRHRDQDGAAVSRRVVMAAKNSHGRRGWEKMGKLKM
jgi:hypothetical protein